MAKNLRYLILTITIVVAGITVGGVMKERKVNPLKPGPSKEVKIETKKPLIVNKEKEKAEKKILPKEPAETDWQWVNQQKKLYNLTEDEVNRILPEIQERFPDKADRLKALSILRLGTPYHLGCLGEESGRDKDPIFRLDVTDCTVFVLTNVALLYSQDLKEAREMMKYLNYRSPGQTTFENRLHFTTDRNAVSPYFQDITGQIAGKGKTEEKRIILNKPKADGKRLIDINWEKEIIMRYIPSQYITRDLLANFPKAVGIAFIREGDEKIGLDVRHEGFLFDGRILFHASSVRKKVVADDFFKYYFGKNGRPRFDGIVLFKVGDVKGVPMG